MKGPVAIVLAAGRGTRMKSDTPKVLHNILGRPVIDHLLDSLDQAGIRDKIVVIGYGSALLEKALKNSASKIVIQKKLLGSGDAVSSARRSIARYSGDIIVACGDTPLIKSGTIKKLIDKHRSTGASVTILAAEFKDPAGYGRIVRQDGRIVKIAEEEEAGFFEEPINEINVGAYCFKAEDLFDALGQVKAKNKKKEYYLTDTIEILYKKGRLIESVMVVDEDEAIGINTRLDLARATKVLRQRVMADVMMSGVTIQDPGSTTIYLNVSIGRDSVIYPNTFIESDVEIGRHCHIGPFARIRGGSVLADHVEIGNFVELVRTKVGRGSKIKHHTYLGDTTVGVGVNIGAGTITANYDGKNKNRT